MMERTASMGLSVLYQTLVVLGIAMFPVAMLARRLGLPVPYHRALRGVEGARTRVGGRTHR